MDEGGNVSEENDKKITYCQKTVELQKCFKSIVETILRNVTEEKFIEIYKNCYKEFELKKGIEQAALSGSSKEARKYRNQFNAMLTSTIGEAIDDTVLNMDSKMKELEDLKKEQSKSTIVWRPPGNAQEHMVPFDYVCELEKKKELEKKILQEQETLDILKARLLKKRKTVTELHELLLSSMRNIENLVTADVSQ